MKTLKQLTKPLQITVLQQPTIFANAQSRHPALAAYSDIRSFLKSLPLFALSPAEQHAITRPLLTEYVDDPRHGSYWSALLIVTYGPLLGAMEHVLREPSSEERILILTEHFLRAARDAAHAKDCKHAPAYLRAALLHALMRQEKRARKEPECVPYDEDATTDVANVFEEPLWQKIIEMRGGKALVRAIAESGENGIQLAYFIREAHPDFDDRAIEIMARKLERCPSSLLRYVHSDDHKMGRSRKSHLASKKGPK